MQDFQHLSLTVAKKFLRNLESKRINSIRIEEGETPQLQIPENQDEHF